SCSMNTELSTASITCTVSSSTAVSALAPIGPDSKPAAASRTGRLRATGFISPVHDKHGLGQDHDQHHVNEHRQVSELEARRIHASTLRRHHGIDEVGQYAECQQDLDSQQNAQRGGKR